MPCKLCQTLVVKIKFLGLKLQRSSSSYRGFDWDSNQTTPLTCHFVGVMHLKFPPRVITSNFCEKPTQAICHLLLGRLCFPLSNNSYVGLMIFTSLSIPNANCIAVPLNDIKNLQVFHICCGLTANFPVEANANRSRNSNDLQNMTEHIPVKFES